MALDPEPTLQDIARAAGKSVATVSRALRNHPGISKTTHQEVQRIASKMGYHPHPMVSALMTRLRYRRPAFQESLAFVSSAQGVGRVKSMIDEVLIGAKEEAKKLGYSFDVYSLDDLKVSSKGLLRTWRSHRVRGVVLWNVRPEAPLDLPWNEFAWVVSGAVTNAPKFHRVSNEIFQLLKVALKEVRRRGYRRPGLALSTGGKHRVGFRWVGGFMANAMHYEFDRSQDSVLKGELTRESFVAWHKKFKADVVLSFDEGPKQWIEEMGQDVPGQTGFLHLLANLSTFPAAGVAQDFKEGGKVTVRTLDSELRRNEFGIPLTPLTITVPGTWKEGPTLRSA